MIDFDMIKESEDMVEHCRGNCDQVFDNLIGSKGVWCEKSSSRSNSATLNYL